MDLCVIDWKAITPIITASIASGTALYISRQWSKQKRTEIIVEEVEFLLSDVFELQSLIANFRHVDHESDEIYVKNKILDFKKLMDRITRRNKFFRVALSGEEKIKAIILFENHISSFHDHALGDYMDILKDECVENANYLIVSYFNKNEKYIEILNDLSEAAFKEIHILLSYRF